MAKTHFTRLAGFLNTSRPSSPDDHEMFLEDDGTNLHLMIYDSTNSAWKGIPLTTSTSTSSSTSTSTSTS